MGFFDAVPRPEPPPKPSPQDPWTGPPHAVAPGAVAVELLLGRSEQVAVMLGPLFVWPTGMRMTLWIAGRELDSEVDPYGMGRGRAPREGDEWPPPDVLRFGVEFSDGRRATSVTSFDVEPGDESRPRLWPHGGGGGRGNFHHEYWLWPLPPPGTLTFACSWPSLDLPETLSELDTGPLDDAAARARELWPAGQG